MRSRYTDDIFKFIMAYLQENGGSPSYSEIQESLGISSKATVANCLHTLQKTGKITIIARKARGIRVVGMKMVPQLQAV